MRDQSSTGGARTRSWLLALLLGMISIGAGVVLLFEPGHSLRALAVITGVFVLIDGLFRIALAWGGAGDDRGLILVLGVFDVVVGVLLIRHPGGGVTAVALILGIWLIAVGVLRMLAAPMGYGSPTWRVLSGLILAVAGIVIVANPHIGYGTLAIVAAVGFIGYGLAIVIAELDRQYVHSHVEPPGGREAPA